MWTIKLDSSLHIFLSRPTDRACLCCRVGEGGCAEGLERDTNSTSTHDNHGNGGG